MTKHAGRLLGVLLLLAAGWAYSADVQETLQSAYTAFLEGRLDDCASAFRYLATLGLTRSQPDANIAILSRDQGKRDEALADWVRASLLEDADGFIWNQRAWTYVSADRPKEARESFLKAIDRSSTTASQAEANVGLGMAALQDSRPKEGMSPLRSALVQGPYILSAASFETAMTALALNDTQAALAYLRQSVDLDPLNLESLREMARVYEKIGENRSSWLAYHRILTFDPKDEDALERTKKLAQFITGDPETSLPIRRLSRPLLDPDSKGLVAPSSSSDSVRVALFTLGDGSPATATSVYFVANGPFSLISSAGEVVKDDGRGFDQWQVEFRPENNLVEVRDAAGNIQYTSKQPFVIQPKGRLGSVLLKSPRFVEASGFDPGDRELRGQIQIVPTPFGFKIVNELDVEDYLYGVVGAALPQYSPSEAYKAQAVVARTLAYWSRFQAKPNLERSDICDSERCQRYVGVNEEMREATKAVAATEGLVLTLDGHLAKVAQHENCGGVTEDGARSGDPALAHLVSVTDAAAPSTGPRTPLELERWTHDYPPRDRFCEAGNSPEHSARWVRIIDAKDLKTRIERVRYIGAIKHIRAVKRSPTGRIQSLEVVGARETITLEGAQAISDFLSPGSLRSTLFTITPIMSGSNASKFILWGAGTGSGLGMCRAGAVGQAGLGRDYLKILGTYFPKLVVDDVHAKPKPAKASKTAKAAAKGPVWKSMPKNPRRKKPADQNK